MSQSPQASPWRYRGTVAGRVLAVYTLLAMWMFRARSAWRMWRWLLIALAVLAGIDWVLRGSAWPA